jgi:hypothetical protein
MGFFRSFNSAEEGAAWGKADADADVKAGGFAKGWAAQGRPRCNESTDEGCDAYEEAYRDNVPRSWWS